MVLLLAHSVLRPAEPIRTPNTMNPPMDHPGLRLILPHLDGPTDGKPEKFRIIY